VPGVRYHESGCLVVDGEEKRRGWFHLPHFGK
jgi:hypothetical protein